jgi:hypothetical protein
MPRYDYLCPANGRLIEASHPMSVTLRTWGEVCQAAGLDPGKTPAAARVQRMIAPSMLLGTKRSGGVGHGAGGCCGEAGCHG